jgi:hypothetical protein
MLIVADSPNSALPASSGGEVLTLLLISLGMVVVGALLAFDIGGLASANHKYNTGFTPWGRKLVDRGIKLPKPYKVVGWGFLAPGAVLLLLATIALIVRL